MIKKKLPKVKYMITPGPSKLKMDKKKWKILSVVEGQMRLAELLQSANLSNSSAQIPEYAKVDKIKIEIFDEAEDKGSFLEEECEEFGSSLDRETVSKRQGIILLLAFSWK